MGEGFIEDGWRGRTDGWKWVRQLLNTGRNLILEFLNGESVPNFYLAASGECLYFGTRKSGFSPLSETGLERVDIAEYFKCCRVRVYEDTTKLLIDHPDELVTD